MGKLEKRGEMAESREDIMVRQEKFLDAMRGCGTIMRSCASTGIPRRTYRRWVSDDPEFRDAVEVARLEFGEYLEGVALERVLNPDKGHGTDVLLITMLNANNPQKYRPQGIQEQDAARELLGELRRLGREVKVEGKVEELAAPIERTLTEILEKRTHVVEKGDGDAGDQPESLDNEG